MNSEGIFETLPVCLFDALRKQLLLGALPASSAETILRPLLSDFFHLALQLPSETATVFENILRIYSDLAQRYGLVMKPPLAGALLSLAEHYCGAGFSSVPRCPEPELDLAAEPQLLLPSTPAPSSFQGQGFFTTDRGATVHLDFSCSETDQLAVFQYRPTRLSLDILINAVPIARITPSTPTARIPLQNLIQALTPPHTSPLIHLIELP